MEAIGHIFTILIIQPIFNLLVFIYAVLPGHNFGLAIILFTVLVRLMLWPLVKKQLHQAKAMQRLQPELKRIKKAASGDRQKESRLVMELYREKGINPFGSIGIILVQLPILFALWKGVLKIVEDPGQIIGFSYSWMHNFSWMQSLATDIHRFDDSLFGIVNLTNKAFSNGNVYWPAIAIAAASALAQYFQSKQLLPNNKQSRGLRSILSDAGKGKSADQQEVSAAAQRTMIFFLPVILFFAALQFPAALPLYWLTNSVVAYFQQAKVLSRDEKELVAIADEPTPKDKKSKPKRPKTTNAKKARGKNQKRRRR